MGKKKKNNVSAEESFSHNPFAGLLGGVVGAASAPVTDLEGPTQLAENTETRWNTKIVVRKETKGRSGKTVTRVSGLSKNQLPLLLPKMKQGLGCGGVIEGEDLVLLGSLIDRVVKWLEAQGAQHIVRGN